MARCWTLALAVAACIAWFLAPGGSGAPRAAGASAAAVARAAPEASGEACRACHPDVVRSYRQTGMANTLGPVVAGELEGLKPVADADTGYSYAFEQHGSTARIVESWKSPRAPAGAPPSARNAYPLAFAVGAGKLDRSYVALAGEGMAFAPLEVLSTAEGRRATLAPGHAIRPGTRMSAPIAEECLSCHTDRLPARDYPLNLMPSASAWQPQGIGCGACHQRADEHAAWRERDLAGEKPAGADPLVAVESSDAIASVSSCARCHLQGDARVALAPHARGVPPPGPDLLAQQAVFVAATHGDEIGFVSHVERMVRSACFTGSQAEGKRALTCVTCHDPHRSSFDPAEREHVRGACLACHPAGETGDAHASDAAACTLAHEQRGEKSCVDCHMRRTRVFDVAEVMIHDHHIRTRPGPGSPAAPLRVKESKDGRLELFAWPGRAKPAHAGDPGLWTIATMALGRADLALPFAERAPGKLADALPMVHHVRGSVFEANNRLPQARAAYERALALDPAQAETSVNLGALLVRLGDAAQAVRVLDRVVERHPRAEGALRNRALAKRALGDEHGFAADLEAAFRLLPQAPVARALADHHRKQGDAALALEWLGRARQLDPAHP